MSTYTVSLEPASEDDLSLFAQWWNNCKIADGCRKEVDPLPAEDNIERFRIWCHEESDSGFGYAIRNQEGLCVGCISAWGIADPERDATLSIMVGPYYQGHGYGSQALTIALHRVLNFPEDKLIWDVGHQSYTHKILTGRRDGFDKMRKYGGMSGFPKRKESDCDAFDTGHSSTSISAGLGYVAARDLQKQDYTVVSVIGDGALTGGMAYEALNNAARLEKKFYHRFK